MNDLEQSLCLYRQMETAAEAADTAAQSELAAKFERAVEEPGTEICDVGRCALRGEHLIAYVLSAGRVAPREELDGVVAPSCAILDIPHDTDTEIVEINDEIERISKELPQPPHEV